jgi:DNA-binding protein
MSEEKQEKNEKPEVKNKEAVKEKKVESRKPSKKASEKQNIVYVGNKPPMDYVMAVMTAFYRGNGTEVTLKARGRAISTAVDVAEITRNRFFRDTKVHTISIGTEEVISRDSGNPRNVSTMEIGLKK